MINWPTWTVLIHSVHTKIRKRPTSQLVLALLAHSSSGDQPILSLQVVGWGNTSDFDIVEHPPRPLAMWYTSNVAWVKMRIAWFQYSEALSLVFFFEVEQFKSLGNRTKSTQKIQGREDTAGSQQHRESMFVWWTETRIIEHGGFVQCTLLLGPSGLVMINHLTASDQWKQPSKRLTLMEHSAVSLSTGHLEPRICDVVVRLTVGTVMQWFQRSYDMQGAQGVERSVTAHSHLAQLLVLVQGQMVVLHCLRRVSKTTVIWWRVVGGMQLLVKAISAGQSRLRSRQEHPNRCKCIYLACTVCMLPFFENDRSGYVLCMV